MSGMSLAATTLLMLSPMFAAAGEETILADLKCGLRVLNVAAHPDDEDAALLVWYRTQEYADTSVLYTTRGEGGQNAIGRELYEELGILRENEILAATEVYEARPWFLGFEDFGYSKRAEEAFERWGGEEEVVRRMTRMIRRLKPHRIFTHHDPVGGHGHHRATSIALRRAVVLAKDPSAFPEQIEEGLEPWSADVLFEREFVTRRSSVAAARPAPAETSPETAPSKPDLGSRFDPARQPPPWVLELDFDARDSTGESVAKRASRGFRMHESQGPWPDFQADVRHQGCYRPVWLRQPWASSEELPKHHLVVADLDVDADLAADTLKILCQPPEDADRLHAAKWRRIVGAALGLDPEVGVDRSVTVPAEDLEIKVSFPGIRVPFDQVFVSLFGPVRIHERMHSRSGRSFGFKIELLENVPITFPRHLSSSAVDDPAQRFPVRIVVEWKSPEGFTFSLLKPLVLEASPKIVASVEPQQVPWIRSQGLRPIVVTLVMSNYSTASQTVWIRHGGDRREVTLSPERDILSSLIRLPLSLSFPPESRLSTSEVPLPVEVQIGDEPPTELPVLAEVVDLETPQNLRVGFVRGMDGIIGELLESLGVEVATIEPWELSRLDLSYFSNVILDVRVLENPEIRESSHRLLEFVRQGGHLLVLYQRAGEWNAAADAGEAPAPHPLKITSRRVCEEDAEIVFLQPDHPLLTTPHRLTAQDFKGWVQERGLYFPHESYDDHYLELLSSHDTGEAPLAGGLLFSRFERGSFTYCAYVLHRQVREAHPGALRLLLNLLAAPALE